MDRDIIYALLLVIGVFVIVRGVCALTGYCG